MRRKTKTGNKEVSPPLKEHVQDLNKKVDLICLWLSKKFDDFSLPVLIEEKEREGDKNENESITNNANEHSYCLTTNTHNLFDLADEVDNVNLDHETGMLEESPTTNSTSLNTPKKKSTPEKSSTEISFSLSSLGPSTSYFQSEKVNDKTPVKDGEAHGENGINEPAVEKSPANKERKRRKKKSLSPHKGSSEEQESHPASFTSSSCNNNEGPADPNPKPKSTGKKSSATATNKDQPEQSIQCEICGKLMNGRTAMKRHVQTHTQDRPFSCTECGKSFQRRFHLKTHLLIHNGEKKHQCRFCGKLFLLPKDIVAHERVHTGEKPFACDHCPRKFTLKSHLVMHLRIHTGEKPYKCDSCDKCFSQANSLRVHKKTHNLPPIQEDPTAGGSRQASASMSSTVSISSSSSSNSNSSTGNNMMIIDGNPHSAASSSSTSSTYTLQDDEGFNILGVGQLIPISIPNQLFAQIPAGRIQSISLPVQEIQIPLELPLPLTQQEQGRNKEQVITIQQGGTFPSSSSNGAVLYASNNDHQAQDPTPTSSVTHYVYQNYDNS